MLWSDLCHYKLEASILGGFRTYFTFVCMHKILKLYNHINDFGKDHRLDYEVLEPGKIRLRFIVERRHMATPVAIHGGMVAAMMDAVLGVTALSKSCEQNRLVSTVEFKINYLNPAHEGDELIGIGKVEQQGNRIIIASADIVAANREDKIVAKGIGTFNAYPVEKSGILERLSPEEQELFNL